MTLSNNSKSDMEFSYLIRFISFFLTFCFDFQILHLHETVIKNVDVKLSVINVLSLAFYFLNILIRNISLLLKLDKV